MEKFIYDEMYFENDEHYNSEREAIEVTLVFDRHKKRVFISREYLEDENQETYIGSNHEDHFLELFKKFQLEILKIFRANLSFRNIATISNSLVLTHLKQIQEIT